MSEEKSDKKKQFFIEEIRTNGNLSFGEKVFLTHMRYVISANEKYLFTNKELSEIFCVTAQTINNWIKKLIKDNLIEVVSEIIENDEIKHFMIIK